MQLTLAVYVYSEREEGRSVYECRPLRGAQHVTRDPLLGNALAKLGAKMRKSISEWIKDGRTKRIEPWLYDDEQRSKIAKLTLVLRDRTLRWKLLLVGEPAFDRWIVSSPSIPDVSFEVSSWAEVDDRAVEVYTQWAQTEISRGEASSVQLPDLSELWIEPLDVQVETPNRSRKKSKSILAALFGGEKMSGADELHKVGHCLDETIDDLDPIIGRKAEIEEVDAILQREDRQGVLIVGPRAVGKTAVVQQCARLRRKRHARKSGERPQTWWLSPQRLVSGMSYLGQWEQRWLAILKEASKRDHILYFDDFVGLFTAGLTRDSSLSAADVLRSYLSENRVRIIAEITAEQLAILRRRNRALADQFHLVHLGALTPEDSLPIVMESIHNLESAEHIFFHPETLPLIMRHQEIFAPDGAFPGKAIDMVKALSAHAGKVVDKGGFYQLAGAQVGANLMLLLGRLGDQQAIQESLDSQLIGQPDASQALSKAVLRFAQQLQPSDRPLGVFLFLGPTGVGKTESAKALTRLLYSDESHLIRLDMNELTTPIAAEQLVGTFDQPEGRLTAAVRRQPNCVILLDEIEKAHPDVFDYLLQVIGEGRLTDARGRVADFRSAIIIMTSNLGASEQSASLGFDSSTERRSQIYRKAAQSFFRPEFINRIDDIVAFRSLSPNDMERIVGIQLEQVLTRDGLRRRDVFVHVSDQAIQHVIQSGYDAQLGARAVRRMLESQVIRPLGDCLSELPVQHPVLIEVREDKAAGKLDCAVTRLRVLDKQPVRALTDLDSLVSAGEPLLQHYQESLAQLLDPLREADEAYGEKITNASYYALREQLYTVGDLLKNARHRLSRNSELKLDLNASPSIKPATDLDHAAGRRHMQDWFAQEDVRDAVRDSDSLDADREWNDADFTSKILQSFALAKAMIEFAMEPREWLLGFLHLTNSNDKDARAVNTRFGNEYEILSGLDPCTDFLSRLILCLNHRLQYEVNPCEERDDFFRVSGVSAIGILAPLLGTYRWESPGRPSHLSTLVAIPCSGQDDWQSLEDLLKANRIGADLRHTSHQKYGTYVIRGVLGESTQNLANGARVDLPVDEWFRSEKVMVRYMHWWLQSLELPEELLEAN